MTDREVFIDRIGVRLRKWDADIADLEAEPQSEKSDIRTESAVELQNLLERRRTAEDRLEELNNVGQEARKKPNSGAETGVNTARSGETEGRLACGTLKDTGTL